MESNLALLTIVICTYNRAKLLDRALEAISLQDAKHDGSWNVLVVDNNCTDNTREVVEKYSKVIPGLRIERESRQGLTEARQKGFHATTTLWVGFVDDDCLLESDWVRHALVVCKNRKDIAAFNGRNRLLLENNKKIPSWVSPRMFAAFDKGGEEEIEQDGTLHGAGLVLRREAVVSSGWLKNPMAEDRRGSSLVSGGDNELAIRARAAGGGLWFIPQCRMRHYITLDRIKFSYLIRLNFCLAEAGPSLVLMQSHGTYQSWLLSSFKLGVIHFLRPVGLKSDDLITENGGVRAKFLSFIRALGYTKGVFKVVFSKSEDRKRLIGLATDNKSLNSQ